MRRYRADPKNRDRARELSREHYQRNRDKILAKQPESHRRKTYGLTPEQFCDLHKEQGGVCAICGEPKKLYIDHDHGTGEVRGLLCNRCNTGLRVLEEPDRLRSSQEYLARRG